MPRREYALQNVNLSLGSAPAQSSSTPLASSNNVCVDDGVVLLVGRSASGKSTLLRLLAGMELPSEGCVSINSYQSLGRAGQMPGTPTFAKMGLPAPTGESNDAFSCGVRPVILDGKPDFDSSLTVMEWIVQAGLDTVHQCRREWKCGVGDDGDIKPTLRALAADVASLLTLTQEQCNSVPTDLSPSGEYLFGIACSCMMSIAPSIAVPSASLHDEVARDGVHYPILLFDELFDTEHPSTVDKCRRGILNLIDAGAVVVSATHRPGFFEGMATRTVTLSGGKVLSDRSAQSAQQTAM